MNNWRGGVLKGWFTAAAGTVVTVAGVSIGVVLPPVGAAVAFAGVSTIVTGLGVSAVSALGEVINTDANEQRNRLQLPAQPLLTLASPNDENHRYTLGDSEWSTIWSTVWGSDEGTLSNTNSISHPYVLEIKKNKDRGPQLHHSISKEQERTMNQYHHSWYKHAIENGSVEMAFGRIVVLGKLEANCKSNLLKAVLNLPAMGLEDEVNIKMLDRNFDAMKDEDEIKDLVKLTKKVIEKNPDGKLSKVMNKVKDAFKRGDCQKAVEPTAKTEDRTIGGIIRTVLCNLKAESENPSTCSSAMEALLHASECSAYEFFENFIPAFITSRSLFLLLYDMSDTQEDQSETINNAHHWIKYIHSSVAQKGKMYYEALSGSLESDQPYHPPYPKILVLGPNDIEHSCITKELKQQLSQETERFTTIKTVRSDLTDSKEIQQYVNTFVSGLKIEVPLSWELFRKILHQIKKERPYVAIETVASLAQFCSIPMEEFQTVLNFYHEHGAVLHYSDVNYLENVVIIDPKWLLKQFNNLYCKAQSSAQKWKTLKNYGILNSQLCNEAWKSDDEHETLNDAQISRGLMELMISFNLAAEIKNVPSMVSTLLQGKWHFIPFLLGKHLDEEMPRDCKLCASKLQFTFNSLYIPPGCFVRLVSVLLQNDKFQVNFNANIYRDKVTFFYGDEYSQLDQVIIASTSTCISVFVFREEYCGQNYSSSSFSATCRNIFNILDSTLRATLKQWFGSTIKHNAAFWCHQCQTTEPHFIEISPQTEHNSAGCRCQKGNLINSFTFEQQFWLKMTAPKNCEDRDGNVTENEVRSLVQEVDNDDFTKILQALEIKGSIDSSSTESDKYGLLKPWCEDMKDDGRQNLAFHLERLKLANLAKKIKRGEYPVLVPEVYDDAPILADLNNRVAAMIPAKWKIFARQLRLEEGVIENVNCSLSNQERFEEVLVQWKKRETLPYTWMTIIEALQTPAVGETALANITKQWYMDKKGVYSL